MATDAAAEGDEWEQNGSQKDEEKGMKEKGKSSAGQKTIINSIVIFDHDQPALPLEPNRSEGKRVPPRIND